MKFFRNNLFILLQIFTAVIFYRQFFFLGKLPIPADTIVGLYHPYRDLFSADYPSGIPFRNFLITDPVRQQYVWRKLAVDQLKQGLLPVWNPYSFAGTPLLANFQSAVFYPLNILYLFLPFSLAWSWQIVLSTLMAGMAMYLFLRNLKLDSPAAFIGGVIYAYGGFAIAWLEWNTLLHAAAWVPLALLAADKLTTDKGRKWPLVLSACLLSSFLAGHLQVFIYGFILVVSYLSYRLIRMEKSRSKHVKKAVLSFGIFILLSLPQALPTLNFILNSYRTADQSQLSEGFFLPWQNLIQFLVPDFFGNPATGNYFGVWNYGEFIGFIGVGGLVLAISSILLLKDATVRFFAAVSLICLLFALPTPAAALIRNLNIPFLSSSQPTRLLFLLDLSLSVLAALAFQRLHGTVSGRHRALSVSGRPLLFILNGMAVLFFATWLLVLVPAITSGQLPPPNQISLRNLIWPTSVFMLVYIFLVLFIFLKTEYVRKIFLWLFVVLIITDLLRFGWKFTSFSEPGYLYPESRIIKELKSDRSLFRIMSLDRRILPPNFSVVHGLYDVSGYDPLYLTNFALYAAAWDRQKPDISPSAFNRIVTPQASDSFLADLLNVKYILSYGILDNPNYSFIINEGETFLYRRQDFFPRAFLVNRQVVVNNAQEAIEEMYDLGVNLRLTAVSEGDLGLAESPLADNESAQITAYLPNLIKIKTAANQSRLLVLSEIHNPFMKATVDTLPVKVHRVDLSLTGIIVPPGNHEIQVEWKLL
ncbi:MAG: hypothetical protein UV73_C0001G0170 [Candidatus Gottesmanbacteria bacterium GW2011_GWA2_43_14]|uniref:YfhO family protein n=1 Tax=Candidatus Gottesmanbacteria bacterium GW2011_GWA2_43_14 TaxID=1618443 RepID=A0A0G1DLZ8_9BACT|nr:MAG: hypothetical protein UV73_C0001G0170 [Candidatus Gottesmanbacteria bacterium GW2011_GWA2_43_14]